MIGILVFILTIIVAIVLIPFVNAKWKGMLTILAICINTVVSAIPAIKALGGTDSLQLFPGSFVTGIIPIRIDALSGWFILLISFTFLTGAVYGFHYMKVYKTQTANLSIHCISYIINHASLLAICSLQNSVVFLIAWEIMALSSFFLVIFEHYKQETLKAGINFLIQSHICILFLMLGFIGVAIKMHSFDFTAITAYSIQNPLLINLGLFLTFFAGFAIKAGFVPFHTWLPYAHPAAPAHVSGIMSGVIIKIGIYGIMRMLLLIRSDYTTIGYVILFFSILSGIYGVMLAILQHNLKKLLAYHSIENIGIIGIGIGLGCIGLGTGNHLLTLLGFAGALLHTLNHSLFKSILFYSAGNIYQSTHTMNIEKLGGLAKRMPHTALLFLVAALAICGLPPFNGFISEFLIYSGMLIGLKGAAIGFLWTLIFCIFGLALIGGLALLCFTKAFGTVFLGFPRILFQKTPGEAAWGSLLPMYAGVLLILLIGLFPAYFMEILSQPVSLYLNKITILAPTNEGFSINTLNMISLCAFGVFALTGVILLIRKKITSMKSKVIGATWGCAYTGSTDKMQYTASSFVRTYRKLAEPLLSIEIKKKELHEIFPSGGEHETRPYDKAEKWFVDYPVKVLNNLFSRFSFLQNGILQIYILYGVAFVTLILVAPLIYDRIIALIHFLNQL
jgi:formate hydrogenlyase subunit 3/multisubunit Na+/H+ antiporter MnhD subunit